MRKGQIRLAGMMMQTRAWSGVANCGCKTKFSGEMPRTTLQIHARVLGENGKPNHCIPCLKKMAAICPRCLRKINLGDKVTEFFADEKFVIQEGMQRLYPDTRVLVACRKGSCGTATTTMGHWVVPGAVLEVVRR